ncbi:MAG TPA: hypothetical protein VKU40_12560 [Thermoanaerobaculia bacterium]|nr:hypothetical protein [Thermoanaerobaculia bacterium]
MHKKIEIEEVAADLSSYIDRVAHHGERFLLTQAGTPIAELRPVPARGRLGDLPKLLTALPRLDAADAAAFADDLAAAREQLRENPPRDQWES